MEVNQNEIIRALVCSSFLSMVERRDIALLNEFKNNPNALESLLVALGADEKILTSPAHRETLEEMLKQAIDGLVDGMNCGREECGYDVKFHDRELEINVESFSTQDGYKIKIDENSYLASILLNRSAGVSSVKKR